MSDSPDAIMGAAYQAMAGVLVDVCPADFEEAWITGALQSGHSSITYSCDRAGKTSQPDTDTTQHLKVDDALHDLRTAMTRPSEQSWSRCTFTLFPDGRFNFDVQHDD